MAASNNNFCETGCTLVFISWNNTKIHSFLQWVYQIRYLYTTADRLVLWRVPCFDNVKIAQTLFTKQMDSNIIRRSLWNPQIEFQPIVCTAAATNKNAIIKLKHARPVQCTYCYWYTSHRTVFHPNLFRDGGSLIEEEDYQSIDANLLNHQKQKSSSSDMFQFSTNVVFE